MFVWGQELSLGSGWCLWLLCFSHLLRFVDFSPVPWCGPALNFSIQPQSTLQVLPHSLLPWHLPPWCVLPASGSLSEVLRWGGDRVKGKGLRGRYIWKSLRTAVLRYGFPAGSHFIFYSPVCIPTMHRGKWGFLYFSWKKPPTWEKHWVTCFPLNNFYLLVLFSLFLQWSSLPPWCPAVFHSWEWWNLFHSRIWWRQ